MSIYDDLAKTILTVTTTTPAFPPAGLVVGQITAARYLAPNVGEVEVRGVTGDVLPIPLANWLGSFVTQVAAAPAAMVGREVLILVASQRAFVIGVMGVAG